MTPLSVDIRTAAEMVGCSTDMIRRAIKATDQTHLPAKLVGSKQVIQIDELRAWISRLADA